MPSRAQTIADSLLEAGPDDVDPQAEVRRLQAPAEAMRLFVMRGVDEIRTHARDDDAVHQAYAQLLEDALETYGELEPGAFPKLFSEGIKALNKRLPGITVMNATDAREFYGDLLIGIKVETEEYGEYPGGAATITAITPDPEAEEIALQVNNPNFTNDEGEHDIGVFGHETIAFYY